MTHQESEGAPRRRRATPRSAYAEALRLLARRPRTRREIESALNESRHSTTEIERTLERLESARYLDDLELSRQYILARATRLGHGRTRLRAELQRRGVSTSTIDQAWRELVDTAQIEPKRALELAVRRRVGERGKLDLRAYARVYNALLRSGFEAADIRRELEPFRSSVGPNDVLLDDGTHDEFP